ncbi:hypothetical protein IFM89_035273 [Coptis chinensis]|uniref:Uncharacterized protein n=1 Tax=Coptis chinensis TaxID=261450 RepID=A0A835LCI5_9MAGN|nr:hypothetical protein IFM89_035273 [Coptis chinensis]
MIMAVGVLATMKEEKGFYIRPFMKSQSNGYLLSGSDEYYGGEDYNNRMVKHLLNVKRIRKKQALDLTKDKLALCRVHKAADQAKIKLSSLYGCTCVKQVTTQSQNTLMQAKTISWRCKRI